MQDSKINFMHLCQVYGQVKRLIPDMKVWVNSTTFKEKYIATNYPYPPLLNPDQIPYQSISADLAWELNLPLPNNYGFTFLTSHAVGRSATSTCLAKCGVPTYLDFIFFDSNKYRYIGYYNILKHSEIPSQYNMVAISEVQQQQEKFFYLLRQKPFLILCRDPISCLKTLLNYPIISSHSKKDYTLQDRDFLVQVQKHTFNELGVSNIIPDILDAFNNKSSYCRLIEKAIVIQTDDVAPQNAFTTFKKLSNIFGFEQPKEEDRIMFETTFVQGIFECLFPIILKINKSDFSDDTTLEVEHFYIYICSNVVWFLMNMEKHLGELECITSFLDLRQQAINDLTIKMDRKYFCFLQKDLQLIKKIKHYLEQLLFALYEQNELYKKGANITQEDILTFFRYSTNCRKKFKTHLDERVAYFKEYHPGIVASWKYYLEFEKMCAELDSTESITNNLNSTNKKEEPD